MSGLRQRTVGTWRRQSAIACAGILLAWAHGLRAAEMWPRFRGPEGTGIAPDAAPPSEWSEHRQLRWRTILPGPGASSPIRSGERVWVTCYTGYGENGKPEGDLARLERHLVCLDAATGRERWRATVPAAAGETAYTRLAEHGYASQTPATDGERVYVFFGKSGVLAFDQDGRRLWQQDVGAGSGRQGFGSAASLVLCGDLVIVNAADESRSLRALDKATGRERWRAEGGGFSNLYQAPLVLSLPDGRRELVLALQNKVAGFDPETGRAVWSAAVSLAGNLAASPVAADGVVYAFGGNQRPATVAIRAGGRGDVTGTHVKWTVPRGPDFGTPILHGGHLYYATARGTAVCLEAETGAEVYQERLRGGSGGVRIYASPVLADGKLFYATRGSGTLVLAAEPVFRLLARNVVADDNSDFSATPMLAGREIFLRSDRALYCFAAAAGVAGAP